jgi:hypothetical protein
MRVDDQRKLSLVITVKNLLSFRKGLFILLLLLFLSLAVAGRTFGIDIRNSGEYREFVHSYVNSGSRGNWTYIEKPMFPVFFNDSQIGIGKNWSIVCPLEANHSYHTYFYGKWICNNSNPMTDYDVYVYDPSGNMMGYHTESAGLPEHLGSNVSEPYFVPKISGNYTYVVRNDPRESKGAEQATFMIIENAECNVWHEIPISGTDENDQQVFNTVWAYDFSTESQRIEVWIRVPKTLDMYEARLYLMANPTSGPGTTLCGVPLAWEQALYGNRSGIFGGYNLESKEYRGLVFASCEYYGEEMLINYTCSLKGISLYHLVLIGEKGFGNVEFLPKTEFGKASLQPLTVPSRAYPMNNTTVEYFSNSTQLLNATLQYSIGATENVSQVDMEILGNNTCRAEIPGQKAGTTVKYFVEANDFLENKLESNGSYSTKYPLWLNISLPKSSVLIGDNVTIHGYARSSANNLTVTVTFASTNQTKQGDVLPLENGAFNVSYKLTSLGIWTVQASSNEDELHFGNVSNTLTIRIEEPSFFVKYSLYFGAGLSAVAAVGIALYVRKLRS